MKRRTAVSMVVAAVVALMAVAPSIAGKGGNKGNNSTGSTSSAWVTATPNPATVGSHVSLTGCGYSFNPVSVLVTQPNGSTFSFWIGMWSSGCLDSNYFVPNQSGTYGIQVFQGGSAPVASTSVSVS